MEGGSAGTSVVMAAPLAGVNMELLDELFGIDLWQQVSSRLFNGIDAWEPSETYVAS
jgi:hypothetical protein